MQQIANPRWVCLNKGVSSQTASLKESLLSNRTNRPPHQSGAHSGLCVCGQLH
jgi:hypothetical protein